MIVINEKVLPTIKAVDYQRADYRRVIWTSSRNRQSNSTIKRNIKLQSPKCQLDFKTSIKILTNQSQIHTKMQPETISHPKHIIQTSDNDNISKSIKRKDTKQGKLKKKKQWQIHQKRNSQLNALLQRNSKPTLCLQQRYIYIQRKYTEMNPINEIFLVSQHERQYKTGQSHRSIKFQNTIVVYVTVIIYYFLMFFVSCGSWISDFSYHFFYKFFRLPQ